MCAAEGKIIAAECVDHIVPHRGDVNRFWNGELQSLCKWHHDAIKQEAERKGFNTAIGVYGWPLDQNHPFYRKRRVGVRYSELEGSRTSSQPASVKEVGQ